MSVIRTWVLCGEANARLKGNLGEGEVRETKIAKRKEVVSI